MAYTDLSIQPRVVRWGGATITDNTHMTKADTAYTKGMLVRKTTSGTVQEAAAVATGGIHGVILEAVTAGASKYVPVMWIAEDTVFEAQIHHATAASAVPAQALVGDSYRIKVTSGIWGVDIEEPTTADVEILDSYDNYMDYDTGGDGSGHFGFVRVRVLPTRLAIAPAAAD